MGQWSELNTPVRYRDPSVVVSRDGMRSRVNVGKLFPRLSRAERDRDRYQSRLGDDRLSALATLITRASILPSALLASPACITPSLAVIKLSPAAERNRPSLS